MGSELKAKLEEEVNRCRIIQAEAIKRTEPLVGLQVLRWDVTMLRVELIAMREELEAQGFNADRYQLRLMDTIEKANQAMCDALGIVVTKGGKVI